VQDLARRRRRGLLGDHEIRRDDGVGENDGQPASAQLLQRVDERQASPGRRLRRGGDRQAERQREPTKRRETWSRPSPRWGAAGAKDVGSSCIEVYRRALPRAGAPFAPIFDTTALVTCS